MKKLKYILLLFIISSFVFAQVPVINSFSPSSGTPGTVVNIYGNYFRMDNVLYKPPADYTSVKFGSYSAYPTSVTATHITVPVPNIPYGNYQISVANQNGRTYTSSNFQVTSPSALITNISYLHGFNANNSTWSYVRSLFSSEFDADHTTNNSYNGTISISQAASTYYNSLIPYNNTVAIAHSMGGVLAREMNRQKGSSTRIKALITVGTPHKGAPISRLSRMNAGSMATQWTYDLAYPWTAYYTSSSAWGIATYFLGPILDLFNYIVDPFNLYPQAADDLRDDSQFIANLNSNPSVTLPNATYTIFGHEDWYSHWRLADVALNDNPENGDYVNFLYSVLNEYAYQANLAYNIAYGYLDDYYSTWDPNYLDEYYYWYSIASAFNSSLYAIHAHQYEWNAYMVGEPASTGDCRNDAFIPRSSQAPDFVNSNRHYEALHTNHMEETSRQESIDQIRRALRQSDINFPQ